MGDVLFALETLASLKNERPDLRVDFLVEDRFAAVLRGHTLLEDVLEYPRRRLVAAPAAIRRLRRKRYDAVLDLHGNLKSAVHARLARTGRRLGYGASIAREGAQRFYTEVVDVPEPRPHRADQGYHLLRALGLRAAPAAAALPPLPDAAGPRLEVILHPGTSAFAAFKRWPLPAFGTLAARLCARGLGVGVSVGPGEHGLAAELRVEAPQLHVVDGAALGILGLAAAFRRARVVVAADTGPLHLAAAADTSVVALFGPKEPAWYGPRGPEHRVLYHDVPCRPCRRRTCPSPQCMLGLEVEPVLSEVLELLQRSARPTDPLPS